MQVEKANLAIFDEYMAIGSMTAVTSAINNNWRWSGQYNRLNSYGARLFTASANTPKRREQNLIVRSGRSEVEVRLTIEDCARRIVYTIEANYTDRHEASSGLSATAGLLVNVPQR